MGDGAGRKYPSDRFTGFRGDYIRPEEVCRDPLNQT